MKITSLSIDKATNTFSGYVELCDPFGGFIKAEEILEGKFGYEKSSYDTGDGIYTPFETWTDYTITYVEINGVPDLKYYEQFVNQLEQWLEECLRGC